MYTAVNKKTGKQAEFDDDAWEKAQQSGIAKRFKDVKRVEDAPMLTPPEVKLVRPRPEVQPQVEPEVTKPVQEVGKVKKTAKATKPEQTKE